MSKYTTGEIAKLCGVSVRTVQYYDTRNILVPSELSEGGRRLYSDEDLQKMKIICFLREVGLSINSIGELLSEEDPGSVISILLEQHEKVLCEEIEERQSKLNMLEQMKHELKGVEPENFSVKSIGDIAYIMENKKKLKIVRIIMVVIGIVMDIIELATLILWIRKGIWWPFASSMALEVIMGILISIYYYRATAYICPKCHTIFKPSFKEVLFAAHTPKTRKLTCTCCKHKSFCVEVYDEGIERT
ncbi:MAG: MerR family transcriptional regulator [Coprococcus sp.]|nr:MerR family transcriptional regulator [Coprococcus sp.]